jgi:hypothetical protein
MSLFEDGRYQYRETYFVLFDHKNRPKSSDVERLLIELGIQLAAGTGAGHAQSPA